MLEKMMVVKHKQHCEDVLVKAALMDMVEQQLQHLRAATGHPGQLKQFVLQLTCLTLFDLVKELFTHSSTASCHKARVHLVCLEFINVRAPGQGTAVSTAPSRPH